MHSQKRVSVGQDQLTVESINHVAEDRTHVRLDAKTTRNIRRNFNALKNFASKHEVYGVTTSLGDLLHKPVGGGEQVPLNVVRSHATGIGELAPEEWIRATILVKAHQLSLGHSGVNPVVVQSLIGLLKKGVIPDVPKYGSVGDGDLAPHAHIALVLVGEGEAFQDGRTVSGARALKAADLKPVKISKKDALSLISGTAYSTAIAALAIHQFKKILDAATKAAASGFEVIEGNRECYAGQLIALASEDAAEIAKQLRKHLKGAHYQRRRLQDPLSFRCVPQVHGTVLKILKWAERLVEREANSVSDNPIVVENRVFHGGNFYNSNVAVAVDVLAQGLAYLGGISERRIQILLESKYTGLPEYLSRGEGDVGMMIAQYSAAALTARLRALATPYGIHSIPTSGLQEDFVPMTTNACIRLHECVEVCRKIIAIELSVAAAAGKMKKSYGSTIAKKIALLNLSGELSKRFVEMERLIADGNFSKVN